MRNIKKSRRTYSPRKILFLVSSMNSGGAERVAANLANAWTARGDAVTLVATFSGRGECFYALSAHVKLIYLTDLIQYTAPGIRRQVARFRALRRCIRDAQPDVVLSFLTNVNIAAILACTGLGYRVIVSERTHPPMLPVGLLRDLLRRLTYPYASCVVMLTVDGLQWLRTHIARASGVVIPNPIPFPLESGKPELPLTRFVAPERKLLLAVGRLDEGKQFDRLVEAFAAIALQNPSWDLAIVGEGPERGPLERRIAGFGLGNRVALPGRAGNIGDWYHRADLYVMSSRFEGFPNTLVEAMAHGCPVVSYDCDSGPRDIVQHELDGLLVRPVGDVNGLSKALDRLMRDEAERKRMAKRAIEVRERYAMEKVLAIWDELFDKVAAREAPR